MKPKTLLEERCEEYGIQVPKTFPLSDDVLVWRFPPVYEKTIKKATKKAAAKTLIIPQDAASPSIRGILLAAGHRALDDLDREGIRLGHTVVFKRFAGWEHEQQMHPDQKTPEHKRHNQILHIRVSDILTSDDLFDDVEAGRTRFVKDATTGQRVLEQKQTVHELAEYKAAERRRKLMLKANDEGSPEEAKVAQRLLAQGKDR